MLLTFIFITLLLFFCYLYKRKLSFLSSVDIFVIFYSVVIIFTILYHNFYPNNLKINLYDFDLKNLKKFDEKILVFFKWIAFFLFGHLIFRYYNKRYQSLINEKITFDFYKFLNYKKAFFLSLTLIILSSILVILDYGTGIFYRVKYIPYESSYFKLIYNLLFLGNSFLCGYYFRFNKMFFCIIIFLILIFNLSIGTRVASITLIVFFFSYFLSLQKIKKRQVLFTVLFVLVFFGYNLSLRSEAYGHGLIPYIEITILKPEIILKYTIDNIYYTFVFGFYATIETIKDYNEHHINNLIISLNPLTGGMAEWYLIAKKMRLNIYAPYTGIGELYNFQFFFFFFVSLVGYFFSYIDLTIKENLLKKKYIQPLILLLFSALFCILMFEYNLRNATRYLYYCLFILIIFKFSFKNGKIYFKQ